MTPSLPRLLAVLFLATLLGGGLGAQATRGSVVPDGKVALSDGTTVEVQDLKAGATLWSWVSPGKAGVTRVTEVRRQHSDTFLQVKAGDRTLQATGAHRVAVPGGKLVRLDTIKVGDVLLTMGTAGPQPATVTSTRVFPSTLVTYDLTVEGHGTFLVDGVVVGD